MHACTLTANMAKLTTSLSCIKSLQNQKIKINGLIVAISYTRLCLTIKTPKTYGQWRRGRGGPETRRKIANVVGNCRKIVKVVGNCQSCRWGGEVLNVVVRKIFWFVGKFFSVCRKSTALGPPPKKNMGPTAPA